MATAETVDLGPVHAPKEDSIEAFDQISLEIKKNLVHLRHDYGKHEKQYFAIAQHLDDHQLAGFNSDDLKSVRVAVSAYGIHLFGKVRIPALPESGPAYIHFRAFIAGGDEPPRLHSIHTEESDDGSGGKSYRAIFNDSDELEWFET